MGDEKFYCTVQWDQLYVTKITGIKFYRHEKDIEIYVLILCDERG